jgi:integrase
MSLIVKETLRKLRDGRLHLYQQNDSKNWFWRTFLNGKYVVRSTKTNNLALATSTAENEYDKLRFEHKTPEGTLAHSWEECEQGLLNSLVHDETARPSRSRSYKVKLAILRQYFSTFPIHTIKTRTVEDYLAWRRNTYKPPYRNYHSSTVSNKTLRSDLGILRQVLKYAYQEEFIKRLPIFPKLTVTPRPGGWFTPKEMVKLIPFSKKWITQATTPDEGRAREYAHLYMMWLVHTGMRVDEALEVWFEDVQIYRATPPQHNEDCLFVTVKGGKLSYVKGATQMIGLPPAVRAFEQLKLLTPNFQLKDLIFPVNPRQTIRALLDAAKLLLDENGKRRTAKSFRHTYIMTSLMHGVDVYVLAKNCRTSVRMIEQHYGSYLNAKMKRAELTKMFSQVNPEGRAK